MSARKILPETVAYAVNITTRGYHGATQHPSILAALRHAQSFGGRSCVCIRRRVDGKRFSIEELSLTLR